MFSVTIIVKHIFLNLVFGLVFFFLAVLYTVSQHNEHLPKQNNGTQWKLLKYLINHQQKTKAEKRRSWGFTNPGFQIPQHLCERGGHQRSPKVSAGHHSLRAPPPITADRTEQTEERGCGKIAQSPNVVNWHVTRRLSSVCHYGPSNARPGPGALGAGWQKYSEMSWGSWFAFPFFFSSSREQVFHNHWLNSILMSRLSDELPALRPLWNREEEGGCFAWWAWHLYVSYYTAAEERANIDVRFIGLFFSVFLRWTSTLVSLLSFGQNSSAVLFSSVSLLSTSAHGTVANWHHAGMQDLWDSLSQMESNSSAPLKHSASFLASVLQQPTPLSPPSTPRAVGALVTLL